MTIKTTTRNLPMEQEEQEQYPCLKQGNLTGMIVLFTAPKTGMILEGKDDTKRCRSHQKPGYLSTKWANEDANWTRLPDDFVIEISNG